MGNFFNRFRPQPLSQEGVNQAKTSFYRVHLSKGRKDREVLHDLDAFKKNVFRTPKPLLTSLPMVLKVIAVLRALAHQQTTPKSEQFEFIIGKVPECTNYMYGRPSKAGMASLREWMKNQLSQENTLEIKIESNTDRGLFFKIDRRIFTLNSDLLRVRLKDDSSTLSMQGYSAECLETVTFFLCTTILFLDLTTYEQVFNMGFAYELKAITALHKKLVENRDPLCLLSELRKELKRRECGSYFLALMKDICCHFAEVIEYPGIVDLELDELLILLTPRDEIHRYLLVDIRNELQVYYAAMDWLAHREERLANSLEVCKRIRFEQMNADQLKEAFDPHLVQKFPKRLRDYMFKVYDDLLKKNPTSRIDGTQNYQDLHRNPDKHKSSITCLRSKLETRESTTSPLTK